MEIIPAIDILDGKCVRLTQGNYRNRKTYSDDPLKVAKMFEDWGFTRLHLVDLDGAREKHIVNYKVLEELAKNTELIIDFGGGIKSDQDISRAFDAGAAMITGGSVAVNDPHTFISWLEKYGNDRIILGADHRRGKISTSGWTETSEIKLMDFIAGYRDKGIKKVICTDISMDGMLKGTSLSVYRKIRREFDDIYLIASGGAGRIEHIADLEKAGIQSVIIGKAFYEGRITRDDIKDFLDQ